MAARVLYHEYALLEATFDVYKHVFNLCCIVLKKWNIHFTFQIIQQIHLYTKLVNY